MAQRTNAPITVEEFERMIASGVLTKDDRVELIEGVLVEREPIGAAHAGCVAVLDEPLQWRLSRDFQVRVQSSIEMQAMHMPQPDLALPRRDSSDYRRQRPRPEDVLLLIDVCDLSLVRGASVAPAGCPEAVLAIDEILGPSLDDRDSAGA